MHKCDSYMKYKKELLAGKMAACVGSINFEMHFNLTQLN